MNRKQIIKLSVFRGKKKMMSKKKRENKINMVRFCLGKYFICGNYFNFINKMYYELINIFFFVFSNLLRDSLQYFFFQGKKIKDKN